MIILYLLLKGLVVLCIIAFIVGMIFETLPYLLQIAFMGCRNIFVIFIIILILGVFAQYWKSLLIIFLSVVFILLMLIMISIKINSNKL